VTIARTAAVIVAVLCAAGMSGTPARAGDRQADAATFQHAGTTSWTESASTNVFKDALPLATSGRAIKLDTARNEYESGQVMVRRVDQFTINNVDFSALRSGSHSIEANNVKYNFIGYRHLNENSHFDANQPIYPVLRTAPADFPDDLSNERTTIVPANTTQPIWVTVFVPKTTAAGVYTGSATVRTNKGNVVVPLSVNVRAVTIPDAKDGAFTVSMWNTFNGEISWKPDGDTIKLTYDYDRFTPKWWQLMENVAQQMKEHRTNDLAVPLVGMLLDGGSTANADGTFTFKWDKFDQVVQFFVDRGVIKRLEGFDVMADTDNYHGHDGVRDVELISRDSSGASVRDYLTWSSDPVDKWVKQFYPALKAHLEQKGWASKFWTHIGDEPDNKGAQEAWNGIAEKIRAVWPDVKLGDAIFHEPWASQIAPGMNIMVPNLLNYSPHPEVYDNLRKGGRDLFLYNCNIPVANYLNRFLDQAEWHQRMTMWYAFTRNANGYLHYSMNGWLATLDNDSVKGDHYIVWPDKKNNKIMSTIRYESQRDGAEDYEVLNILAKTKPGLAHDLAYALTKTADTYTSDPGYMARIRALVLDAAAGKPVVASDLARVAKSSASSETAGHEGRKATDGNHSTSWQPAGTGTQTLTLALPQQAQVDGVRLSWGSAFAKDYKIQVSYDGTQWTDGFSTTNGDGGDDFVGLNAKAQYVRLVANVTDPISLADFEIAGFAFPHQNVAGGRGYSKSEEPAARFPDSGIESTDGVLADDWGDGRSYSFGDGQTSGSRTVTVTVDLGSAKRINNARVHAYEEYPDYRPDSITVATSTDGSTFTQVGTLSQTNDVSRMWYDFSFQPTQTRYLKLTFNKTYNKSATGMFIDEIEAYGA
jgi:hypothetical protein